MSKKIIAAIIAVCLFLACVPFITGCSAKIVYTLNESGDGYVISYSGYGGKIKGDLVIEETHEGKPVTEIALEGFRESSISSVTIPKTVTAIGNGAFANCKALKSITFAEDSAIKEIPRGMCGYSYSLTNINIPDTVEKIGILAFIECKALVSVSLPDAVTEIGACAFQGCERLQEIALGNSLQQIGELAFESCAALKRVTFPQTLTSIGELAFYFAGLEEVTIPNSVTEMGYGVFHSCISLKTAVVGEGITKIKAGVFGYCTALETVYLPKSLKEIEGAYYENGDLYSGHAFHTCTALSNVYFAGTEAEWQQITVNNYEVTSDGIKYNNDAVIRAQKHYGE